MSTHRIILIEDDATEARLAQRTLTKIDASLEVIHLNNGADFIDYFTQPEPPGDVCLAIMDLHMPIMSGIDVLQQLHDTESYPPFPIVLFSSTQNSEEIQQAYALGGSAFVTKPDNLVEYREAVRNIINFWITTNRLR